jgi:phage baseplate assembly protein W
MKYSDISPNFVTHTITDKDSIRNSIKNLVLIKKFSILGAPKIGSRVTNFLFKNMNYADVVNLKLEIKFLLINHEPRITVENVLVDFNDDNSLFCNIIYFINSSFDGVTDSVKIKLDQGGLI